MKCECGCDPHVEWCPECRAELQRQEAESPMGKLKARVAELETERDGLIDRELTLHKIRVEVEDDRNNYRNVLKALYVAVDVMISTPGGVLDQGRAVMRAMNAAKKLLK